MQLQSEEKLTKTSLYDMYRDAFDKIAIYQPNIAEMAKHFTDTKSMEDALCYGPSVVIKWAKNANGVSKEAERRAEQWIKNRNNISSSSVDQLVNVAKDKPVLLLVTCPSAEVAAKCERILRVMNCEAVEV